MCRKNSHRLQKRLVIDALERRALMSATTIESEPNNVKSAATAFSLPADGLSQLVGEIANKDDRDFFRFSAAQDGVVKVTGLATSAVSMEVENSLDQDVFETEPKNGVTGGQFRVAAGITYFVRLKGADVVGDKAYAAQLAFTAGGSANPGDANGDQQCDLEDFSILRGDYGKTGHHRSDLNGDDRVDLADFAELRRSFGKRYETHEDDGPEDESGGEKADATQVSFSDSGEITITGISTGHDDKDFYTFVAPASGKVQVDVATSNGNFAAVEIETAASVNVLETEPNDGQNAGSFQAVEGTRYYLRARSPNAGDAAYTISLKLSSSPTGGGDTGGGDTGGGDTGGGDPGPAVVVNESEPNDSQSASNAFQLAKHVQLSGSIATEEDRDFFRFVPTQSGKLTVSAAADSGINVEVERYYAVDDVLELEPHDGVTTATVDVVAGALYYLRVRGQDGAIPAYAVDVVFESIA